MQPLKTIANPNCESTIGCCDADARSIMLNRRWPNATRFCIKAPPASGPRGRIRSFIAAMQLPAVSPLKVNSPQIPHIFFFRKAAPRSAHNLRALNNVFALRRFLPCNPALKRGHKTAC
jgi:hypothetical protein